jgi:hypothetical protein
MEIRKIKSTQHSFLLWAGLLFFIGTIILTTTWLLTDRSEKDVARLKENLLLETDPLNPDHYSNSSNIELVAPSLTPELASSSLESSGTDKIEAQGFGIDSVSTWGSLHTKYGDIVVNEKVNLISEDANQTYSETSDENGHFNFENIVPAADYQLLVSPKGMYQRVSVDSLEIFNNQTVLALVLEPLELGTLRGKVINAEGIVVPGYEMKLHSTLKTRWVRNFSPDIIGEFIIENVPIGPIKFAKTFGQALEITGHKFSGNSQSPIELVVDVGYHELSGVVYDEFNNVVPGATVVLDWRHRHEGANSIVTRRSTTRPTGEFRFQGLGKGEHELLVTTFDGLVSHQIVNVGSDNSERVVVVEKTQLYQD